MLLYPTEKRCRSVEDKPEAASPRPRMLRELPIGDVHRHFETEAQIAKLRFAPFHGRLLKCYKATRLLLWPDPE